MLTVSEVTALRTLAHPASATFTATAELARKNELKARSTARYTHWPNTLEAQRQKKELERRRRLDAIESAQQEVDERERAFHDQQRRATIARANNLLYQENDRVKTFRSSLLVSNALHERTAQGVFKDEYKAREAHARALHEQQIAVSIAKQDARDARDAAARDALARDAAAMRLEQLKEKEQRHIAERREEMREGALVHASAAAALAQGKAAEAARRAEQRQRAEELVLANQDALRVKAEQARLIEAENAKIAHYAAEKERVAALRAAREQEKREAKQARVDGIISRQQAHLSVVTAKERERLEKELAAMNFKEAEKERIAADRYVTLKL